MLRAVPPGTNPLLSHPTKFGQADRGLNHLLLTRTSKQPGQITTEEGRGDGFLFKDVNLSGR